MFDAELVPITIKRETGAVQSLLLKNVHPLSGHLHSIGVLLEVVGGFVKVPLHSIYLTSGIVSGQVSI